MRIGLRSGFSSCTSRCRRMLHRMMTPSISRRGRRSTRGNKTVTQKIHGSLFRCSSQRGSGVQDFRREQNRDCNQLSPTQPRKLKELTWPLCGTNAVVKYLDDVRQLLRPLSLKLKRIDNFGILCRHLTQFCSHFRGQLHPLARGGRIWFHWLALNVFEQILPTTKEFGM